MNEFRKYKLEKLFRISTGGDVIISTTPAGNIPLISHQHGNNGIAKYVRRQDNMVLYKAEETIALADRGVFYATVQNKDFYIGTRVKALTFLDGAKSLAVRLYVATAINMLQPYFVEYSQNATDDLPNLSIELPAISDDIPDYSYMECYIKTLEAEYISKLRKHLTKTVKNKRSL